MGKVLIAFAPPDVREHLLDTLELPATGPNTITDRDALRAEIAGDAAGTGVAALAVAAPAFRASMEHLVGFVPVLTAAAHELALRLPTGRAR